MIPSGFEKGDIVVYERVTQFARMRHTAKIVEKNPTNYVIIVSIMGHLARRTVMQQNILRLADPKEVASFNRYGR